MKARSEAGAALLRELYALTGKKPYAQVIARSELLGTPLSKATITNLLAGTGAPRARTVQAFVLACMDLKPRKTTWPPQRQTAQDWIDAYDIACGRTRSAENMRPKVVRVGVRPRPAAALQPRAKLVDLLGAAIDDGKAAVLTQPLAQHALVLSGLGGVGKSQLAAYYATQQWHDSATDVIVWANAATTTGIIEAYAEAAAELLGSGDDGAERDARRFLQWAANTPMRWLIVLDNLQAPGDLVDLWPPATSNGQTVITTRYRGDALQRGDVRIISVDTFSREEGRAYLRQRLRGHPDLIGKHEVDANFDKLASALGWLPLALSQATAYMINEMADIDTYITLIADERRHLDDLVPRKDELPDEHRVTVGSTWSLSVRRANDTAPEGMAWPLLQIAALLDSEGIPETLFTGEAISNYLTEVLGVALPLEPQIISRGLAVLHRYNLITLDRSRPDRSVVIHGLVQRATRDIVTSPIRAFPGLPSPIDLPDLAYAVADAIYDLWPSVDTANGIGGTLRANAAMLILRAGDFLWRVDDNTPLGIAGNAFAYDALGSGVHVLVLRLGKSLGDAGLVNEAVDYVSRMRHQARSCLGVDHPDTLYASSQLAVHLEAAGDIAGAITEIEALLPILDRMCGPDHPRVLRTASYLVGLRAQKGNLTEAVAELEKLQSRHIQVLGRDHPDSMAARSRTVHWRAKSGDVAGSIVELEQLLADYRRLLGPDNHNTLSVLHNLASLRAEAGDIAAATAELEQLVVSRVRVLGLDHPHTLITRQNLATYRAELGDLDGAIVELEQLVADRVRLSGPDHPAILTNRNNLAYLRAQAGDVAGALVALEQLLADRLRVSGPDHPDTLTVRHNLAFWRTEKDDVAEAVREWEQLLADRLRVLGADHPDTLQTRRNLAILKVKGAEPAEAASEWKRLLIDHEQALGPEHPDTLTTRDNFELLRRRACEKEEG